jgi:hypothetical protein
VQKVSGTCKCIVNILVFILTIILSSLKNVDAIVIVADLVSSIILFSIGAECHLQVSVDDEGIRMP